MKKFKKSAALIKQNYESTCAYCLAKLKNTYERKAHENISHEDCGKSYSNSTALNYHLQTHTVLTELECTKCDKRFKKKGLSAHIERVHSEENVNRYFCEVCEKPFSTSSHLSRHRRTKLDGTWATNIDFVETLREIL